MIKGLMFLIYNHQLIIPIHELNSDVGT